MNTKKIMAIAVIALVIFVCSGVAQALETRGLVFPGKVVEYADVKTLSGIVTKAIRTTVYDANGNIVSVSVPDPSLADRFVKYSLIYDSKNKLVAKCNYKIDGTIISYTLYNPSLATIATIGIPITEARGVVFPGRIIAYGANNVAIRTTVFDANGNILSLTVSNAWTEKEAPDHVYVYDSNNRVTAYNKYDMTGNLTSFKLYIYDDLAGPSQYTSVKCYDRISGADVLRSITFYIYDASGKRLTDRIVYYSDGKIIRDTTYTYIDGKPLVSCMVYEPDSLGNFTKKAIYNYDEIGNLLSLEYYDRISGADVLKTVNFYIYDPNGKRLTDRVVSYADGKIALQTTYTYIDGKQLVSWVGYTADNLGNFTKKIINNYDATGHLLGGSRPDAATAGKVTMALWYIYPLQFGSAPQPNYIVTQAIGYTNVNGVDKPQIINNYGIAYYSSGTVSLSYGYLKNTVEYNKYDAAGNARYITMYYSAPATYQSPQHITYSLTDKKERTDYRFDAISGKDLAYQTKDSTGKILYTYLYYRPEGSTDIASTRVLDPSGKILYEVGGILDVSQFVLTGEVMGNALLVNKVDTLLANEVMQKQAVLEQKGAKPTYGLAEQPKSGIVKPAQK